MILLLLFVDTHNTFPHMMEFPPAYLAISQAEYEVLMKKNISASCLVFDAYTQEV